MAKVEIDVDIHENSLDNSADSEYMGTVDEGSYGSSEEKSQLTSQSYLDTNENSTSTYCFKEISGGVTYKLITMAGDESAAVHSPSHHVVHHEPEYYVISNPAEVFGTGTTPKKSARRDPLQGKSIIAQRRDDKRRATHNEVERRRRDKINTWISKLANLIPHSGVPDTASKGGILAKACDYISDLTEKQKRLEKMEVENEKLMLEIIRLNQELSDVRKENSSMRNQLADNCIVLQQRPKGQKS